MGSSSSKPSKTTAAAPAAAPAPAPAPAPVTVKSLLLEKKSRFEENLGEGVSFSTYAGRRFATHKYDGIFPILCIYHLLWMVNEGVGLSFKDTSPVSINVLPLFCNGRLVPSLVIILKDIGVSEENLTSLRTLTKTYNDSKYKAFLKSNSRSREWVGLEEQARKDRTAFLAVWNEILETKVM